MNVTVMCKKHDEILAIANMLKATEKPILAC